MQQQQDKDRNEDENFGAKLGKELRNNLVKIVSRLIWAIIIIIILVSVGKYLVTRSSQQTTKTETPIKTAQPSKPIEKPIPWNNIDQEIVSILHDSKENAGNYANTQLDKWVEQLMKRVDDNFLEWYFGYFNQQMLGFKALYAQGKHWWSSDNPTAAESITATVQEEFANRVLRPQIAQLEIEHITQDTVHMYIRNISTTLDAIPKKYNVPQEEWDKYLHSLAVISFNIEGNRQVELTLKALTGGATLLTLPVAKMVTTISGKIGSKMIAMQTAKTAEAVAVAATAEKVGWKVAAKMGGKFVGTIAGVGIIAWDVYDHYSNKATNKPIMRQNLVDYLQEVKKSLLYDTETGIMSVIYTLEGNTLDSIRELRK